ncbi:MAG: hypothetical protein JWR85_3951 [Marmoricola sp.]|nr:hypothetical protein [Marmoricola sp.]
MADIRANRLRRLKLSGRFDRIRIHYTIIVSYLYVIVNSLLVCPIANNLVCIADVSICIYKKKNDDLKVVENRNLVELLENNLHPVTEELGRWQDIIGEHYIDHKPEEQRNCLAHKHEGYITIY